MIGKCYFIEIYILMPYFILYLIYKPRRINYVKIFLRVIISNVFEHFQIYFRHLLKSKERYCIFVLRI